MAAITDSYERLEDIILQLPRMDRSKLATRILESLDEDDTEPSPEWREELQRRVNDIDAGRAKLIPSEEVWEEANLRFGTKF